LQEEIKFLGLVDSFFIDNNKDSLLVFLPAANGKSIHPRHPRFKWRDNFKGDCSLLYLSDPYQGFSDYQLSQGSWYINASGGFVLPDLANELYFFIRERNFQKVVFYGSSMGGTAAIILSSLIPGSIAIAECPQLFMLNHRRSRIVIDKFIGSNNYWGQFDPIEYVKNSKAKKLVIICSIHDRHYSKHFLPFVNIFCENGIVIDAEFLSFSDPAVGKGHVVLQFERTMDIILRSFNSFAG